MTKRTATLKRSQPTGQTFSDLFWAAKSPTSCVEMGLVGCCSGCKVASHTCLILQCQKVAACITLAGKHRCVVTVRFCVRAVERVAFWLVAALCHVPSMHTLSLKMQPLWQTFSHLFWAAKSPTSCVEMGLVGCCSDRAGNTRCTDTQVNQMRTICELHTVGAASNQAVGCNVHGFCVCARFVIGGGWGCGGGHVDSMHTLSLKMQPLWQTFSDFFWWLLCDTHSTQLNIKKVKPQRHLCWCLNGGR